MCCNKRLSNTNGFLLLNILFDAKLGRLYLRPIPPSVQQDVRVGLVSIHVAVINVRLSHGNMMVMCCFKSRQRAALVLKNIL